MYIYIQIYIHKRKPRNEQINKTIKQIRKQVNEYIYINKQIEVHTCLWILWANKAGRLVRHQLIWDPFSMNGWLSFSPWKWPLQWSRIGSAKESCPAYQTQNEMVRLTVAQHKKKLQVGAWYVATIDCGRSCSTCSSRKGGTISL